MKIFHLSDLHIGKMIYGYDMEEDQLYVFEQIIEYIKSYCPKVVIIAGDIYDKALPSARAVKLFDDFLTRLAGMNVYVLIISGNHDSAERLDYGSRIMEENKVFIKGTYKGEAEKVIVEDEFGQVNFYLLPFIKPIDIREYTDKECTDYTDAMSIAIEKMNIDEGERNVLVAHQNVTNSGRNTKSESEIITIGTIDNIEAHIFDIFDYVALGHLHKPQNIGSKKIRYCGTPVKYSMSEACDEKSVTMIELNNKGDMECKLLPLKQLHGWCDFKGSMEEALNREYSDDYTRVMLTDKNVIIDALYRLRNVYGRLLTMEFEENAGRLENESHEVAKAYKMTPSEAFENFYKEQRGTELSLENKKYIDTICSEWEVEL